MFVYELQSLNIFIEMKWLGGGEMSEKLTHASCANYNVIQELKYHLRGSRYSK